jgi:hypothetical protein
VRSMGSGTWPMIGSGSVVVEHEYQRMTDGPAVTNPASDPFILVSQADRWAVLAAFHPEVASSQLEGETLATVRMKTSDRQLASADGRHEKHVTRCGICDAGHGIAEPRNPEKTDVALTSVRPG